MTASRLQLSAAPAGERRSATRALRRAARAVAVLPFAATTLGGCYSYSRVDGTAPPVGGMVAAEINDRGRVALADSLGSSPGLVEGRLLSADDSTITLAVSGVRPLRGERVPWTNERITLRRTSFDALRQRQLSVARSAAVGAGVVGGIVAFIVTLDLLGSGSGGESDRVPGGGGKGEQ